MTPVDGSIAIAGGTAVTPEGDDEVSTIFFNLQLTYILKYTNSFTRQYLRHPLNHRNYRFLEYLYCLYQKEPQF